ncbi:PucR family transcriptional regulator [Nocardiopsis sp. CNT312]|uniref:PucR family transcriptional regulator n=1 Tax=Nocardiopsis sp. CNT312 TaxID=1137268 RepID=UPI0004906C01|nr:PucR family transcriptional regulator [Nocardiopsis sp. CNT312]
MRISELIAVERLRLRFLTGAEHAHRTVRWVYTTDLLEPARYLRGGEFVLTGMMWRTRPEDSAAFVASVAGAGAVALGAGTALGEVPEDLVAACRAHGLPLVEVPTETSFGSVTEEAQRVLLQERLAALSRSREGLRRAVAEVAAGADFPEAFADAARQASTTAWVLSCTGRHVAATGAPLPPPAAERLAARALARPAAPDTARLSEEGPAITVHPVRTRDYHPLASWLLVCAAPAEEDEETLAELLSLTALARSRAEERTESAARHLEGLERLLDARRADEAAALLDGSAVGGRFREHRHAAVKAVLLPAPRDGALLGRVLAELVADHTGAVVAGGDDPLALVPVPGGDTAGDGVRDALVHRARILEGGLADHRLALGVSSPVRGAADLRGALTEARHARRLAELRGGRSRVIAASETDSHELLLASVPEEVRASYRDRLLGPLLAYDRDHRSDLVATLERFLAHSGSWQRCAAAMHVHVNTLRYRIGRVEELTGRDLSSLEDRVDLFLALRVRG